MLFRFRVLNNLVIKLILYFIICKLLGFPEISCLSVAKDVYLNDCSKTTHYTQKYLLNCFIVFLSCYSFKFFQQSLQTVLHFCLHKYGSHLLSKWRDMYSQDIHEAYSMLFFDCRTPEKVTRKAGLKVCGWSLETHLQGCNIGFFSLHCLNTGCFLQVLSKRFAHMGAERQTNIHTHARVL